MHPLSGLSVDRSRRWQSLSVAAMVLTGASALGQPAFDLDGARSRVVIEVGKAGAFGFVAGHSHKVEAPIYGTLAVDLDHPELGSAAFEIHTAELTVMEAGEPPEDVPKVQQTMASERVLDVRRYPAVKFQSRAISVRQRRAGALELVVTGNLTLHGTTRSIEVPVHADFAADAIAARGAFTVKQTDYGMKPVTVAGGLVAVKDELKIQFRLVVPLAKSSVRTGT